MCCWSSNEEEIKSKNYDDEPTRLYMASVDVEPAGS
jgi:hypothetical protein